MLRPIQAFFFTVGTIAGWISKLCLGISDILEDAGEPRLVLILAVIGAAYLLRSALKRALNFFRFFAI